MTKRYLTDKIEIKIEFNVSDHGHESDIGRYVPVSLYRMSQMMS